MIIVRAGTLLWYLDARHTVVGPLRPPGASPAWELTLGQWRARLGLNPCLLATKPGILVPGALQAPPTWAGAWVSEEGPTAFQNLPQISSMLPPSSPEESTDQCLQ